MVSVCEGWGWLSCGLDRGLSTGRVSSQQLSKRKAMHDHCRQWNMAQELDVKLYVMSRKPWPLWVDAKSKHLRLLVGSTELLKWERCTVLYCPGLGTGAKGEVCGRRNL